MPRHEPPAGPKYRWTCPVCDKSVTSPVDHDEPREAGVHELLSHIRFAHGEDHEPTSSLDGCVDLLE